MTDERTPVLDYRPHRATDAATPPVEAEAPSRRNVVLLWVAAATVAAGIVVWATAGGDPESPPRIAADVTRPAVTAPATSAPAAAPTTPVDSPVEAPAAVTNAPAASSAPGTVAPGTPARATTALPAGWEARSFEGVTFAVPPGATGPDLVDPGNADAPALFSWNGPSLGGEVYSHVSMWIYSASGAPELGPEYRQITVPGADRAHMWTGPTGSDPATTTVDVHVVAGGRYINLVANVAPDAAGEQTVRNLVASLVVS